MKHPDREMTDEEAAALLRSQLEQVVVMVQRSRVCNCVASYTGVVCKHHWHVNGIQIEHQPWCAINN